MHLLIGFLATALLSGRKGEGTASPLLRLVYPVRTLHLLPGRARFLVAPMKGNPAAVERVTSALPRLQGVESVAASGVTGSVLIRFDPEKLEAELLVAALIRLLGLDEDLRTPPTSLVARELRQAVGALNSALYHRTNGLLDLKTAVPVGLAGLGLYRILTARGTVYPAGLTLVWWAVRTLQKGDEQKPRGRT